MVNKTKPRWKIYFRIAIAIVILYVLFDVVKLFFLVAKEGGDISDVPLPEFNNLFTKETQSKLNGTTVFYSKVKQPESRYTFDNNFRIEVYKLILSQDKPLTQLLNFQNKHSSNDFDGFDQAFGDVTQMELARASGKLGSISNIKVTYQAILFKPIAENDSVACYFLKTNNFSIGYDDTSDYDILGNSKNSTDVELGLAFVKKHTSLYIIMLLTKDKNQSIPPDMLYSFIQK